MTTKCDYLDKENDKHDKAAVKTNKKRFKYWDIISIT